MRGSAMAGGVLWLGRLIDVAPSGIAPVIRLAGTQSETAGVAVDCGQALPTLGQY